MKKRNEYPEINGLFYPFIHAQARNALYIHIKDVHCYKHNLWNNSIDNDCIQTVHLYILN